MRISDWSSDVCSSDLVGVVFDPLDARRDAFLVALEVDQAIVLLVTAANMTGGDPAVMVAATGVGLALDQRRMRAALVQIRGDHTHHGAAARRSGFECHQCHGILPQALAITSDRKSTRLNSSH